MTPISIEYGKLQELKAIFLDNIASIKDKNVVYLDYPVHNNVGDLLIYWGAIEALRINNNRIVAQFFTGNFDVATVRKLVDKHNAIIICHGGGNFGDLYHQHQNLRRQVVSHFKDTKIHVFPQSVFFESEQEKEKQLAEFVQENLTIHVRDTESEKLLLDHGVNVIKTPDCAHFLLDKLSRSKVASQQQDNVLVFRRKDKEAVGTEIGFDWSEINSDVDKVLYKLLKTTTANPRFHRYSLFLFHLYTKRLVRKAEEKFSQYNRVDTDRLHGFILAILMDIPVTHLDNSYQKILKYKSAWL
jgi:pyruvyl transferase EpsO